MWDTFDVCFLFVHQWLCKHISSDRTWSLFQRFIKSSLLSGQGSMAVTFTAWRCQTVTWWRVQALRLSSTEKLVKEGGPAGRGSHRRGSVAGSQNRQPMNMQAPAQPVLRKEKQPAWCGWNWELALLPDSSSRLDTFSIFLHLTVFSVLFLQPKWEGSFLAVSSINI